MKNIKWISYITALLMVLLVIGCAPKKIETGTTTPPTAPETSPAEEPETAPATTGPTTATTAEVEEKTTATGGHEVVVMNKNFDPETITIKVGDTVTWRVADDKPHLVSGLGGRIRSPLLKQGATETFEHTFTEAEAGIWDFGDSIGGGKGLVKVE